MRHHGVEDPEGGYARRAGVHLAFEVRGTGENLVLLPGGVPSVGFTDDPWIGRALRRLASFSRLIMYDQQGFGRSDPLDSQALPTLEDRVADVVAVLDAVGSPRATVFASYDGGPAAILFAATYPERTSRLVLANTWPRSSWAEDWPWGMRPEVWEAARAFGEHHFGTGRQAVYLAPSVAQNPEASQWWANVERLSGSPGTVLAATEAIMQLDVRDVLRSVRVPTLVLHSAQCRFLSPAIGRHLAEHIPGARYVEVPGTDVIFWLESPDSVIDEVEVFVTGESPALRSDRVLATVVFTDIVGSTEIASKLGDLRWRDLLDQHDAMVRRQLERFHGKEVNKAGDGFLATFDGPARSLSCAAALVEGARRLGLQIRCGVHTGEVERRGDDIGGIAVHIGARVAALAAADEVLASRTVVDLVAGSGLRFVDRGDHELRGVDGSWGLFALDS